MGADVTGAAVTGAAATGAAVTGAAVTGSSVGEDVGYAVGYAVGTPGISRVVVGATLGRVEGASDPAKGQTNEGGVPRSVYKFQNKGKSEPRAVTDNEKEALQHAKIAMLKIEYLQIHSIRFVVLQREWERCHNHSRR